MPARTRSPGLAQLVLGATSFIFVFDGLVVNLALPAIQRDLGLADRDLQWTITAYLLPFGGLLLLAGRIGDLVGRRRMLLAGLGLFAAGSLLAAFAPSAAVLLAGRAVQGAGGAAAAPAAMALISATFPSGPQRGRAFAVASTAGSAALVIGAVAGGAIATGLGWRWIFLAGLPIPAAALVLAPRAVPESRDPDAPRRLDVAGALLGTAGMCSLVLGINRGLAGGTIAGIALLAAFTGHEARASVPLLRLGLFRVRALSAAALGILANAGAFSCMVFLSSLYLQRVLGQDAATAGVALGPLALGTAVSGLTASRVLRHVQWATLACGGLALSAAAALVLSFADGYWTGVLPGLMLLSLGVSPTFVALTSAAGRDVPAGETGMAYGVFETFQRVGDTVTLAIVATVVAAAGGSAGDLRLGFRLLVPLALAGVVAIRLTRPSPASA
jgi:MFS family permease